MLPLLRKAPAARIVNVSSAAALQISAVVDLAADLRAPAYSIAKYLLTVLTAKLAGELHDTPILINAVDPGETASHPEGGAEDNARRARAAWRRPPARSKRRRRTAPRPLRRVPPRRRPCRCEGHSSFLRSLRTFDVFGVPLVREIRGH